MVHLRRVPAADLTARQIHDLVRLRIVVFVVEQACPYADLDGRDLEPGAVHLWFEDDGGRVAATLRMLEEGDHRHRLGRIATSRPDRNQGLASRLVDAALERCPGEVILDAQSHLAGWYRTFGFEVDGDEFDEDGIAHVPMRRVPR